MRQSGFSKLTKDIIFNKLLRFGFFPEDASNILSSDEFCNYVIRNEKQVSNLTGPNEIAKYCQFKLTRNNNSPRYLGIIHPYQYIKLATAIRTSWGELTRTNKTRIVRNGKSVIKAQLDNATGRLVSLKSQKNYDPDELSFTDNDAKRINIQIGSNYRVKADIANFYPSIYTHSVTWVKYGREAGYEKKDTRNSLNTIDQLLRSCQDRETIGIPVGPDTSAIVAEYILTGVDDYLRGYKYLRFIDDYECYCNSHTEAEKFIIDLSAALEKFRLRLNTKKTEITQSPFTINPRWLTSIKLFQSLVTDIIKEQHLDRVISFLDNAVFMSSKYPFDSPLKYTIKILSNSTYEDFDTFLTIAKYVFHITTQYPYLISTCSDFVDIGYKQFSENTKKIDVHVRNFLNIMIKIHSKYRRSDVLSWTVSIAIRHGLQLNYAAINEIVAAQDCVSTLFAFKYQYDNKDVTSSYPDKEADTSWWLYTYEKHLLTKTKYILKGPLFNFLNDLLAHDISFIKLP